MDDALRQAEESLRLDPRSLRLPYSPVSLRDSLETLEHETTTIRVLARSLADSTRLAGDDNPMNDPEARRRLAAVLRELSAAVTAYRRLATKRDPSDHELLESEERHLAARRISRTGSPTYSDPTRGPSRSARRCGVS